ncbi:MAG: DNA polymerase III subunit delta [Parachlamydiaceae bacterium]
MRYDHLQAFEKYLEGADSQNISPFYLIVGKDAVDTQHAIDLLLDLLLPRGKNREFALTMFDGAGVEEVSLSQALESGSFFAKSQVMYIRHLDKAKKSIQELLEKCLSRPQSGHSLVLTAATWSKNHSFYKAMEKKGVIVDLPDLKPWEKEKQLVGWVNKEAAAKRKLISYQACQLLVKRMGNDQSLLIQEIEKLICYCGDRKEISEEDIKAISCCEHFSTIWQLGEAIFSFNSSAALQIVRSFLTEGQPLLPLLRQIRSQFQTQYQVALLLAQGKEPQEIAQQFSYMKGQILERNIEQANRYGLKSFKLGMLAIDEAEMRTKNSAIDDHILLELLMMQLTRRT